MVRMYRCALCGSVAELIPIARSRLGAIDR
jgi:hypothetical protein